MSQQAAPDAETLAKIQATQKSILQLVDPEYRTFSGLVLDNLNFWLFICMLTLFTYLIWAIIEIQNHYYFPTAPFATTGQSCASQFFSLVCTK